MNDNNWNWVIWRRGSQKTKLRRGEEKGGGEDERGEKEGGEIR